MREKMDEQTRYRVTGSLFLLAVLIICLPMIFDGEGEPPLEIEPLEVVTVSPEVTALDTVAPDSEIVARADELRGRYDQEGFSTTDGTRIGEPVLTTPTPETRIWAVQVASFSDSENASRMRDKLREQGFEAFISTARSGESVMSRVGVGPLLSQTDAETLQKELAQMLSVKARVMAFAN